MSALSGPFRPEGFHLLLTGATGSVGLETLRYLRAVSAQGRVTCVVRGEAGGTAAGRLNSLLGAHGLSEDGTPTIEAVDGDIEQIDMGLSADDVARLSTVTHVLHLAAHIRFDAPYDRARRTNVEGTWSILRIAARLPKLVSFGQVSTLFVVGRRDGVCWPGDRPANGFNNAYEQTKFEAEGLALASGLPVDVYRLSLMPGRASDGYVYRYLENHMLMEAFCRGSCATLPGRAEDAIDMAPTDVTARILVEDLLTHDGSRGRVLNLSSGCLSPSNGDMYEIIAAALEKRGRQPPPPPRYIDRSEFEHILASDGPFEHGLSPGAQAVLSVIGGYLLHPKVFEPSPLAAGAMPAAKQWMPAIIDHCIDERWGRRRV